MDISIVICTANRANDLRDTLASLAGVRWSGSVELLVVDNRSTDDTRPLVADASRGYPFPLRYLYEGAGGKYAALNSGIKAARGQIIVATDDDARFEPDWLERAADGLSRYGCEFVGGRVLPLWGAPKPEWLAETNGLHTKVIALLDQGNTAREFGRGISWPFLLCGTPTRCRGRVRWMGEVRWGGRSCSRRSGPETRPPGTLPPGRSRCKPDRR